MGILNLFKGKVIKETLLPLDPELIRLNRINRAVVQENQALKGQISELLAEKREDEEAETEEDKQELLRKKLLEEQIEINKKKFGNPASLKKLFLDKKLLEKTEICDKDDKKVFGKLGDMLLLESGRLAITDTEGNVLSYGNNINQVIYKPGTFLNQIKRGRILIPYDSDYHPVVDWEEIDVKDIKYDVEEQTYRLTEFAKENAKKLLIEKDKEIRKIKTYADRIENINIELTKKVDEQARTIKMQSANVENANSELSIIMNQVNQQQMAYMGEQRKIVHLTEVKGLYEDIITRQENIIKNLLEKVEESGDKTIYRKAVEDFKDKADYIAGLKERVKEKVIVEEHVKVPIEVKEKEGGGK